MERLVRRAKRGDPDAFVRLMEENRQAMYKVAVCYMKNAEDAADVMQETVLTAYEKLGTLKHAGYFRTWLIRILINKCKNYLSDREREQVWEKPPEASYREDFDRHMMYKELFRALDEIYRDTLILYYVDGYKSREIARILEVPEATVRTRLRRGRDELKAIIEKEGAGEWL